MTDRSNAQEFVVLGRWFMSTFHVSSATLPQYSAWCFRLSVVIHHVHLPSSTACYKHTLF